MAEKKLVSEKLPATKKEQTLDESKKLETTENADDSVVLKSNLFKSELKEEEFKPTLEPEEKEQPRFSNIKRDELDQEIKHSLKPTKIQDSYLDISKDQVLKIENAKLTRSTRSLTPQRQVSKSTFESSDLSCRLELKLNALEGDILIYKSENETLKKQIRQAELSLNQQTVSKMQKWAFFLAIVLILCKGAYHTLKHD